MPSPLPDERHRGDHLASVSYLGYSRAFIVRVVQGSCIDIGGVFADHRLLSAL